MIETRMSVKLKLTHLAVLAMSEVWKGNQHLTKQWLDVMTISLIMRWLCLVK